MDLDNLERDTCRICLENNECLDWNTPLYQFGNMTYKECYYMYTQLEPYDTDPFPQMLCQDCANALHSTHSLILKALESDKLLQDELRDLDKGTLTPSEFETVLVEQIEVEAIADDHFEYSDEESVTTASNILSKRRSPTIIDSVISSEKVSARTKTTKSVKTKNKLEVSLNEPTKISLKLNASPTKSKSICKPKVKKVKAIEEKQSNLIIEKEPSEKEKSVESELVKCTRNLVTDYDEDNESDESLKLEENVNKKYWEIKTPRMCSICSKILHNKYSLQMHEKTHIENRERKENCKVCGVKFYDKRNLTAHMRIHKENREKRHKCEFCSKTFYDKGALNIHRRIHLGQMIPCSLCSKEFFRQIDLDRHMSSHSATTINSDAKKKTRYYVRCEYCDKSIRSTNFKSHTAVHMNEPLMKCTICDKDFFHRGSCVRHVQKIHNKSHEEYNDFILIYNTDRVSHLFLEQNANIQTNIN